MKFAEKNEYKKNEQKKMKAYKMPLINVAIKVLVGGNKKVHH